MINKKALTFLLGIALNLESEIYAHDLNRELKIEYGIEIRQVIPPRRIIYVDQSDNIIKIIGNSKDIPYRNIQIFRDKEKIKMNARIAYQYDYLLPKLDFKKKKIYFFNSSDFSIQFSRYIRDSYGMLEKQIIERLGQQGNLCFPCSQISRALRKSKIFSLDEKNIYMKVYPDEKKGEGYENISFE